MRICSRCKLEKDFKEFFVSRKSRDKSGLHNVCKSCSKEYGRNWYLKNRVKKEGIVFKNNALLTPDSYLEMLQGQDGKCLLCGHKPEKGSKRLSIDHCHKTGIVRGLLCNHCNLGLGYFRDNIEALKRAIDYLQKGLS